MCHMYMTDFAYDRPIFLVPLNPSYPSSPVLCIRMFCMGRSNVTFCQFSRLLSKTFLSETCPLTFHAYKLGFPDLDDTSAERDVLGAFVLLATSLVSPPVDLSEETPKVVSPNSVLL